jgi:hypothetical protein
VEITDRVHPPMRVPDPTLRFAEIHVRREALAIRVEVRDLPPLACRSRAARLGQPDPGSAGEGGSSPGHSRDVSVLPDGAGPASVTKRSTRGTSVITSDLERIRARINHERVLALVKAFLKAGVLTGTGDREDTYTGTRKEASCPR